MEENQERIRTKGYYWTEVLRTVNSASDESPPTAPTESSSSDHDHAGNGGVDDDSDRRYLH